MGFAGMAALTHEMEDVFELLRQRKGGLERVAIDVLLECLDALSAAVESIDTTGAEEIEPEVADRAACRAWCASARPSSRRERIGVAEPPDNLSEMADGRRVVQVSAILSEDVDDAVRARLHGAGGDRRPAARRWPAGPTPDESTASPGARSTPGSSPSAPTPSLAAAAGPCRTSPTCSSSRPSPTPRSTSPTTSCDVAGRPGRRRGARRSRPPRPPPTRRRRRRAKPHAKHAAPRPSASTPSGSTS